ncbi:ferredoxin--NADP reductase [Thalassotalea euphylliae]|uniref:ferredoxin--NADP reductase n=1 Tax=Thalassotalea euphylliae TaxID=1655234 RepID=UPI0015F26606|nr:ferredoxin--NADP reductase [Thalassotalea euphylliae]
MDFFSLKVSEINKEAKGAKSFLLDVPTNLIGSLRWQPGQHVNVRIKLGEQSYIRSYSLSNCPQTLGLRLTVKAVELGVVSNYLISKLKPGDYLEVSQPGGLFTLPQLSSNIGTVEANVPSARHEAQYFVFFAAGSGITPIFSMITALLSAHTATSTRVYLVYSNRNRRSAIFADKLEVLRERFPNQFTLLNCYSKPGWFKPKNMWHHGRVTQAVVYAALEKMNLPGYSHYFLCGPSGFMETVHQTLTQLDVAPQCIHRESFGGGQTVWSATASQSAKLKIELSGAQHTIEVKANESLLAAMLRAKLDAPFSCEEGVCGSCQCELVSGEARMVENLFLTDEEQAEGKILSCQAVAQSSQLAIKL